MVDCLEADPSRGRVGLNWPEVDLPPVYKAGGRIDKPEYPAAPAPEAQAGAVGSGFGKKEVPLPAQGTAGDGEVRDPRLALCRANNLGAPVSPTLQQLKIVLNTNDDIARALLPA